MKSQNTGNLVTVTISGVVILGAIAFLLVWALQTAYDFV